MSALPVLPVLPVLLIASGLMMALGGASWLVIDLASSIDTINSRLNSIYMEFGAHNDLQEKHDLQERLKSPRRRYPL